MLGDLNVNSKIQIAIDPANKEQYVPPSGDGIIGGVDPEPGQIIFTRDASGHYTFFGYEQTGGGTWGWHAFSTSTSTLSNVWSVEGDGTIYYNDGLDTKVGIGTDSPAETLEVDGNTLIIGDLKVGNHDNQQQLQLRCFASATGPNDAEKGLLIWDGPGATRQSGLFTRLDTNSSNKQSWNSVYRITCKLLCILLSM